MPSISEKSFASRLLRAHELRALVARLYSYRPSDPDLTPAGLDRLIASLEEVKIAAAQATAAYAAAVKARQEAFKSNSPNCVRLLLPDLRDAVIAQYGKGTSECESISNIVRAVRAIKPVLPKIYSAGDASSTIPKGVSESELAFTQQTQHFADAVREVSGFRRYAPARPEFTVAALQQQLTHLHVLAEKVASALHALSQARSARTIAHTRLSAVARLIRSQIKTAYGTSSKELASFKDLKL